MIFDKIREERGELNLIQVCTFGTEGTRSAIAASGRGYRSENYPEGLSVEETQYLSSLIPTERGFLRSIKDCVYGNEEKGWKPIQPLIDELNKYPGLLEIIETIEGIVCRRGIHASGVIMYNTNPYETNALMRSPNGELTTQFSLHDAEFCGDTKFDFLMTEICDKLTTCLLLLQNDNLIDKNLSLRQIYNTYLHPDKIDMADITLWNALDEGKVMDVFQFNTGVGLAAVKQAQPKTLTEMISTNALIRLAPEQGEERPLDKYCRFKKNINLWYNEAKVYGLTNDEIKILEKHYLPRYGVCCSQEDLMRICMDPDIANFSLSDANYAKKIVSKKKIKEVPALKEKFIKSCKSKNLGEYVWKTTMQLQMSYSFSDVHASVYSMVGIQTLYLATHFPEVYWNCACLIVNSGGADLVDCDLTSDLDNKSVNYGKISTAIGKMRDANIKVLPPDINKSNLTFSPVKENNSIIYGIKGIEKVGIQIVCDIIKNRPYKSIEDFLNKVKLNKTQMISLIKSGAFDNLYACSREEIMQQYFDLIVDKKKRITLQNMPMLIQKNLIPSKLDYERRLFNFNKYLKKNKKKDYYLLDEIALKFYLEQYDESLLFDFTINGDIQLAKILCKEWDKIYKNGMEPIKQWMSNNQQEILDKLNQSLLEETIRDNAEGNISKWEMDSLGFYYHNHELANLKKDVYDISDFSNLNEEPDVKKTFQKDGKEINLYNIYRIAGTVVDKDKNKSQITLLTTDSVVVVKVWKSQYAKWDKQIAQMQPDGTKKVLEKSFFTRGNKLIITGIRRGDDFIPKKYKNTPYPLFERIDEIDGNGYITKSAIERIEEV